ncbi:peptidase M61, partial [Sulfolobus sp. D5]
YEIFKALRDYIHLEVFDKDKPYYGIILDGNKVRFVEDDSPADFAGLMPDDQIISIDNTAKPLEVRESVILHVLREGRLKEITLRAGKSPGHSLRAKLDGKIAKAIFNSDIIEAEYVTNVI